MPTSQMRRSIFGLLLLFLAAAPVLAVEAGRIPGEKHFDELDLEVARALYAVLPPQESGPQYFVLMPQSLFRGQTLDIPVVPRLFIFQDSDMKPIRIECEKGTILRVSALAEGVSNVGSAISVGICGSQRSQISAMMKEAPAALKMQEGSLGPQWGGIAAKAGLYFNERSLGGGLRAYHVPILYLTNLTVAIDNIVLLDDAGAWIVQAQLGTLCAKIRDPLMDQAPSVHKLCVDTEQVLTEMAKQVRAKFPK